VLGGQVVVRARGLLVLKLLWMMLPTSGAVGGVQMTEWHAGMPADSFEIWGSNI